MTEIVEQSKELAIMENLTPEIFTGDALEKALAKVRADALSIVSDATTPKGRKEITSRAHRLRLSKAPITDLGEKINKAKRAEIKDIGLKCETAVKEIDSIIAEVRKPLDEYEAIELTRTTGHENALSELVRIRLYDMNTTSEQIHAKMEETKAVYGARDWQEYAEKAHAATLTNLETLDAAFAVVKQRENDQAELKRLKEIEAQRKAEQDERDRINAIEQPEPTKIEFPEQPMLAMTENGAVEIGPVLETFPESADEIQVKAVIDPEQHNKLMDQLGAPASWRADTTPTAMAEALHTEIAPGVTLARIADEGAERRRAIRGEILEAMKSIAMCDEQSLKDIIIAIVKGKIPHISINYGE